MPDMWEARITQILIGDDQSQIFEMTFTQRVEFAPDLQPLIDAYGPNLYAPLPDLATLMPLPPVPAGPYKRG